jgi:hypothetical protein
MIEVINDLITCKLCLKKLVSTVFLPCGEMICESHDSEYRELEEENYLKNANFATRFIV